MKTRIQSSTITLSACLFGLACLAMCAPARAQSTGGADELRALATLGVGAAIGARAIEVPARQGKLQLGTGIHPALDFALSLGVQRGRWSLSASAEYRTSLFLRTDTALLSADAGRAALRSHSLYAGLVPGYRFSAAGMSMRASLFAGWAVRAIRTVAELAVPNYSLHGLVLRPELYVALLAEWLSVRVGPELGVIFSESRELRQLLGTVPPGLALGAALSLELRVTEGIQVVAGYQLAYTTQRSQWHSRFVDIEHFASARIELRY